MGEVSKELIKKREDQREGLERLWKKLLTEYFEKHHEYPPLSAGDRVQNSRQIQQFIGSRPEISRAVANLDMVQDLLTEVALEVLKDLAKEEK
jgi:hypothetical protein